MDKKNVENQTRLMNSIVFSSDKNIAFEKVFSLYENAGWAAYTSCPDVLKEAINQSLYLLTAWHGEQLVGLLRAVGDGLTIVYIQDIIVLDSFRRQGIGKNLISQTLDTFKNVRQILLLTDEHPDTIEFYENAGLQQTKNLNLTSFIRLLP